MKKKTILILIGILLLSVHSVYAKDTIVSMNKYQEEIFYKIENSYNENGLIDGSVILGKINNKEENYIVLVKYNKKGNIKWMYKTSSEENDSIEFLLYTKKENQIDGYLIGYQQGNETKLLKIDLEGNYQWDKTASFHLIKVKEVIQEETVDGYIAVGYNDQSGLLIRYDNDFNITWMKEVPSFQAIDVGTVYEENHPIAFVVIRENASSAELVQYDTSGNEVSIVENDLTKYDSYALGEGNTGYILYGVTSEVKLKKGEKSYFVIQYNLEGEDWETIGDVPVEENKKIIFLNSNNNYFLFYINSIDKTAEVIKLKEDGLVEKKVKKIKSDYYDIEDFTVNKDVLYLVGQINCPSDDECDYNENSLFIISDEDVVIEVKDKDSKGVLIVTGILLLGGILLVMIHKKKRIK